jgi:hypothetical protein
LTIGASKEALAWRERRREEEREEEGERSNLSHGV